MKGKLKSNKGITLIALIITIIVLLILAMVSIKLLIDQGIIKRAESSTSKYTIEQEKELIKVAYADYKIAKAENGVATLNVKDAIVSGNENNGWLITFNKTGNGYTLNGKGNIEIAVSAEEQLELLKKHFLGEDGEVVTLHDRVQFPQGSNISGCGFLNSDVIPNASTKLKFMNEYYDNSYDCVLFEYEKKAYKLQCDINTLENQAVELVYVPTGREGQKVKYSYDGTSENEKEWTILYDYGDTIEIVSPDAIGNLTLGYNDEEAQNPGDIDKNGEANTNLDKAIYSYNNAVSRINRYAASQVTNTNKISVRSAGSNPQNPEAENSTMYKSEILSQWLDGIYNGIGKSGDLNYEQDMIRMSYFEIYKSGFYWLASRFQDFTHGEGFFLNYVNPELIYAFQSDYVWCVDINNAYGQMISSKAVRPVVKISSKDIK